MEVDPKLDQAAHAMWRDCQRISQLILHAGTKRLLSLRWHGIPLSDLLHSFSRLRQILAGAPQCSTNPHGFEQLRYTHPRTTIVSAPVPTVWHLPEIVSMPWYDSTAAGKILERNAPFIIQEYRSAAPEMYAHPDTSEVVRSGSWHSLFFFGAGGDVAALTRECFPQTIRAIESLSPCRNFGFAALFRTTAPTHFVRHTGSANVRLRHQLCIEIAPDTEAFLEVGTERRHWELGKCLIFDDSYPHELHHVSGGPRVVLAVDSWHPDLNSAEREVLSNTVFKTFGKIAR